MTGVTDDPTDPRIRRDGKPDEKPVAQNDVYLVLSEAERAKGFVRPVRTSYRHVGIRPRFELRELTDVEKANYADEGYAYYEKYPDSERPAVGRYWTVKDLATGCNTVTTMGLALSETYAREPHFYGFTYCVHCSKHLPVQEFRWTADDQVVGS